MTRCMSAIPNLKNRLGIENGFIRDGSGDPVPVAHHVPPSAIMLGGVYFIVISLFVTRVSIYLLNYNTSSPTIQRSSVLLYNPRVISRLILAMWSYCENFNFKEQCSI